MTTVLDASALLCFLQDEPGNDRVEAVLPEAVISSVNWAEVVRKSVAAGVNIDGMREDIEALGLALGDRACLSLGLGLNAPVLTADQIGSALDLPITIHIVR